MEEQNLNEMLLIRREKLKKLVEEGKDPHTIENFRGALHSKEIVDNYDDYDEKTVKLENGDRLLLFSDGAIETKDEKRHEYGLERLRGNFESFHDLEESYKDIKNFTWGKQEDDLSLVQIEYKEK